MWVDVLTNFGQAIIKFTHKKFLVNVVTLTCYHYFDKHDNTP